jgi:ribosome recycling factor
VSTELIDLIIAEADEAMGSAVVHARAEFSTIRTGRPSPALVEKIPVDYYGSEVPLQQIASFSVPEAQLLVISPFDKSAMGAIERAIQLADLGLTPSNDGVVLRLNFPPLTEERRRDLVKVVKNMAEEGRIVIRNVRRSARQDLEQLSKDGNASSDDVNRAEKQVDDLTHNREADVNAALAHKEQELMAV